MLKGKAAVITGSKSGIGLGIAEALARAGANVMLNGIGNADEIEKTRAKVAAQAGNDSGFTSSSLRAAARTVTCGRSRHGHVRKKVGER